MKNFPFFSRSQLFAYQQKTYGRSMMSRSFMTFNISEGEGECEAVWNFKQKDIFYDRDKGVVSKTL